MSGGIAANQTSQSPLHLRVTDGDLTATLGTFAFEAQTVPLTPNATNYVFLDLSQNPPLLTVNTTEFPASAVWTIAIAVTNNTKITQLTDSRPAFNNLAFGGGGTPGGSNTQLQYNNAGVFGGIPFALYIAEATALELIDPNLSFVVATGPTQANDIQIDPSGLTLNATESGAIAQINSDGDMNINSNNGNIAVGANGGFSLSGATAAFIATGRLSFQSSAGTPKYNFSALPVFGNNAAAITGGLIVGDLYRTGANPDPVCVVH